MSQIAMQMVEGVKGATAQKTSILSHPHQLPDQALPAA
jgi:hypothetical protein